MNSVYKNPSKGMARRTGKTARDKASGAAGRNASNKQTRADFLRDPHAVARDFPTFTCNGKRNRNPNAGR